MTDRHDDLANLRAELDALRDTVARQQDELDRLRPEGGAGVEHAPVSRRRLLGLAGAGVAGAAVLGSAAPVAADNGDNIVHGGTTFGVDATTIQNTAASSLLAGPRNAIVGEITEVGNGSHAVVGKTAGFGHAVAGECTATGDDNTVGATWGRHFGHGAGAEGVNVAAEVPIAGTANGVRGTVTDATNGSHAVIGVTNGDGHAVAGVVNKVDSARGATWGRHLGIGAGAEGENLGTGDNAGPGVLGKSAEGVGVVGQGGANQAQFRMVPHESIGAPSEGSHEMGDLYLDGAARLYLCVSSGTPGLFVPVGSGGSALLDVPERAFDSRMSGKLAAGSTTTIDLSSVIPEGAAAAIVSITFFNTNAIGYGAAYSAGEETIASPQFVSGTWAKKNDFVTATVTSKLDGGAMKLYVSGATHCTVDVVGFHAEAAPEMLELT